MLRCGAAPSSVKPLDSLIFPFKPRPRSPEPSPSFSRNQRRFSIAISSSFSSSSPAAAAATPTPSPSSPMVARKRKRYRKPYPGEGVGIVEEMRFVAMWIRNAQEKKKKEKDEVEADGPELEPAETWLPSMEGFLKYLVDSKLVFDTLERIVDASTDVSYVYFRRTGLERSASLSNDLEWFRQQEIAIPEPSPPGTEYATYLNQLAAKSVPSFLCHFYNIYFAHIAGGQVIGRKVCEKLLEGRELEFYNWDGDVQEFLKNVRENLNNLGEHWTREEKNRCLREASKSFRFSGQIIRLIIL